MAQHESFDAGDVRIAYDDRTPDDPDAPPIVLVHGFASSRHGNWRDRDWYDRLLETGRRVIALDCRGHGESGKPTEPAAYETDAMGEDVIALLDHLEVDRADLLGYSMGGRLGLELFHAHPERFNAGVLAGIGDASLEETGGGNVIADALLADDLAAVDNPFGRRFRAFAETTDNDLEALAACARARTTPTTWEQLEAIDHPVSVIAGDEDDIAGDPEELAAGLPNGEGVVLEGADHLSAVPDDQFTTAVLEFLEREGL